MLKIKFNVCIAFEGFKKRVTRGRVRDIVPHGSVFGSLLLKYKIRVASTVRTLFFDSTTLSKALRNVNDSMSMDADRSIGDNPNNSRPSIVSSCVDTRPATKSLTVSSFVCNPRCFRV